MSTDLWRGPFGDEYLARNQPTVDQVRPVLDHILAGIEFDSVLEVGCSKGHNLLALESDGRLLSGVEPNDQARHAAQHEGLDVIDGDILDLPYLDDSYDLVLTCGVLIHIAPPDIRQAVNEVVRVTRRYVLAIEYGAVEEEMVEYRGHKDILWRRNFGKLYEAWGGLRIVRHESTNSMMYPGAEWWLLEAR